MAGQREGLRPQKPKSPKPLPKSNAEKCREYRQRIKADPSKYEEWKEKKKQDNKISRTRPMTEEEINLKREKHRLYMRELRAKQRLDAPKVKEKKKPAVNTDIKETRKQASERREKNRKRQAERRANLSSQKKRRINERRRESYRLKKAASNAVELPNNNRPKARIRLASLLGAVTKRFKSARSKLSIFKLNFSKKLLARVDPSVLHLDFYKREPRFDFSVEHFLEKKSIDYPCSKGSSIPKKILTRTMVELLGEYRIQFPQTKMSLTTFKRRRPQNIVLAGSRKFQQCLCEKCENSMLLAQAINPCLKKKDEEEMDSLATKMSSPEEIVNKTLCKTPTRQCWERMCVECGVTPLIQSIRFQIGDDLFNLKTWSKWEKSVKCSKDLIQKEDSLSDIVNFFSESVFNLAMHLKIAEWQRSAYQKLRECLPPCHAMCTLDFAENYLCKFQNEIQSAHWSYRQVTVHPCVLFYRCPDANNQSCCKTITEYIIFLSDDMCHDSHFARFVSDYCINHLKAKGMAALHIFSDGASSQYKSRFAFHDFTLLKKNHHDVVLTRHFFGSNHGKSLCDSCGGTVKNACLRAVSSGEHIIQSALDMFAFCSENLVSNTSCETFHSGFERSFVLVRKENVVRDRSVEVKQVKGTRDIHCLKPLEEGLISWRLLSCFCNVCLLNEEGDCPNRHFTLDWTSASLTREKKTTGPVLSFDKDTDVDLVQHSTTYVLEEHEHRQKFFKAIQDVLTKCETFEELVAVVRCLSLEAYPLPEQIGLRCVSEVGQVDSYSIKFLPSGLMYLYPVETIGDDNCVPRSLSLLVFGDQDHHVEIRVRIAVELVFNALDYLCLESDLLAFLCQHSDFISSSPREVFHKETLHICHNASRMGLWQLMAAANVFGTNILSIYPSLGPKSVITIMNRSFRPRENSEQAHTLCLLWSATEEHDKVMPRDYWTANHVVPLLPPEPIEIFCGN